MKKKKIILAVVLSLIILCALALISCNGEEYIIYFDVDGQNYSEIKTSGKEEIQLPQTPTKEGYTFAGWFWLDGRAFTAESLLENPLSEDIRIFAKWITVAEYTVTFDSSGGSAVSPIVAHGGEAISAPQSPTKEGCTFDGWYVADFAYEFVFSTMPEYNLTLYAKWTDNTPLVTTYTITFDTCGGSGVDQMIAEAGASVSAPAAPQKEGYVFGGWYTDNGTFAAAYAFTSMPEENITLYAKWMGEIIYHLDGGTNHAANPGYVEASNVILEAPQKDGFVFCGWYHNAGFAGEVVTTISGGSPEVSLYAKWTDLSSYNMFSVVVTPLEPRLASNPEKITYADVIEVEVTLGGNVEIAGYQLKVEYNEAQFAYVNGSLVSDAVTMVGSGAISVEWAGDGSNISEGKTVVVFRLQVINSARPDVLFDVDVISCIKRNAADTATVTAEYVANDFYNADYIEGGKV